MCLRPTKEESARSEARRAALDEERAERPEPWTYPQPRGNGDYDEQEAQRSGEKLAAVLGH